MRTELFTVSRIFTESLYRIPDYQRGYSWEVDHLRDFWLDLEQLHADEKHYTGVLTLEDVPDEAWKKWEDDFWIIQSRRYKPYYVVDGQQRLTTVIILLQAIVEAASLESKNLTQLNFTPLDDIRRKYIFDSKQSSTARSYLFGYEKDNPSYEFLKKRIFLESSDIHFQDEETIYTKNLLAAKGFFQEKLEHLNKTELEILFTKVTQQLVFNVYEISSDIDVFVTFETMNNRGKPLSTLELLKNRLIFLSTKLPVEHGNGSLRKHINEAWKAAYHYLGKNDERPLNDDEFLRTQLSHFYLINIFKWSDSADELEREKELRRYHLTLENFNRYLLNELFTPKRIGEKITKGGITPPLSNSFIDDFSRQLKTSVELYFKLSTPSQTSFDDRERILLERLGRLRGFNPSPMLLAIFHKEKKSDKRLRLLEVMERFFFCASLGMRDPFYYGRRVYIPVPEYYVRYTIGKSTIEETTTLLENTTSELFKESGLAEQLHDWVKNGPSYYGWRAIKYFLFEYELSLQQKVKAARQKIDWNEFNRENFRDDYETIEHIYPQRARDKYWTERFSKFNSSQKRQLRNSLGNLLPLAKPRNSSLSNKSFIEKLGDEKSMTGYKFGCYSENEVATVPDWGPQQIVDRGIKLLEFMERRWNISIGDRQQKLRALGIEFMSKL